MRCALVTGGTRGIGRAICERLADKNFALAIGYHRNADLALRQVEEFQNRGLNCIAVQSDLSSQDGAERLTAALRGFPAVDTLINNAGVGLFALAADVTDEQLQRVMNVNFFSAFKLIRALTPNMVSRGFGRIVNITSMWGLTGAAAESVYSASKAALEGLSKSLAKELGGSGITVNCVAPGLIDTQMNSDLKECDLRALIDETPLRRIGRPEDVAKAVELLTDEDCFITGETINVSGGLVIT